MRSLPKGNRRRPVRMRCASCDRGFLPAVSENGNTDWDAAERQAPAAPCRHPRHPRKQLPTSTSRPACEGSALSPLHRRWGEQAAAQSDNHRGCRACTTTRSPYRKLLSHPFHRHRRCLFFARHRARLMSYKTQIRTAEEEADVYTEAAKCSCAVRAHGGRRGGSPSSREASGKARRRELPPSRF